MSEESRIVDDLLEAAPEANEGAILAQETAQPSEHPDVDASGTVFDPERHQRNKTKAGNWKKRPRVSKKEAESTVFIPDVQVADQFLAVGQGATDLTVMLGIMIGGEEWIAKNEERQAMTFAWGRYLESKGVEDIPPGFALSIAILGYAMPRIGKPATRSKMQRISGWVKRRYWKMRGKHTPEPPDGVNTNGAQPSGRNDGIGQEYIG